jgi:RNA polymerase subunit RPABC4/transcription elongation factor Spt4
MFFIGIFGINEKQTKITNYNNIICPTCQGLSHFELFKSYTYFHIFFIPIFRWNISYYVRSACCGNIFALKPEIAKQYENGKTPEIKKEDLQPIKRYLPAKTCHNCGASIKLEFSFCPYCGKVINKDNTTH